MSDIKLEYTQVATDIDTKAIHEKYKDHYQELFEKLSEIESIAEEKYLAKIKEEEKQEKIAKKRVEELKNKLQILKSKRYIFKISDAVHNNSESLKDDKIGESHYDNGAFLLYTLL